MNETLTFLKNDNIYQNFLDMYDDENFDLEKFYIDYKEVKNIIEKWKKIEWDLIYDILDAYNDYFWTNLWINDLYNENMLINFKPILFKTYKLFNEFIKIFDDTEFNISKYDITISDFIDITVRKAKIEINYALNILDLYNDYYWDKITEKELLNTKMIVKEDKSVWNIKFSI